MRWIASGGGLSLAFDANGICTWTDGAQIVPVGEAADKLPAPVLPSGGNSLPALMQQKPADVISGWVRLWIAGFMSDHDGWDGIICALHGDVSHWLHVSANEIVSSQSFLTPRLIASLGGSGTAKQSALADSLSRPERLASNLRVAEIEGDTTATTGLLIGVELAATRPYWLGQRLAVLGEGDRVDTYAEALKAQGCPVTSALVRDVLPKGLAALARTLDPVG